MKLVAFYFQLRRQLSWTVKMLLSETNEKKKVVAIQNRLKIIGLEEED